MATASLSYITRVIVALTYFCLSLTTASTILAYTALLGWNNSFAKRVRSVIGVVTCAPWLLVFGIRLSIENEERVFAADEDNITINVGTHASHIDGLAMMVAYWRNRRYHKPPCAVVKREVLSTPFYGIFAYLVGNILVARGSTKETAVKNMDRVADRAVNGYVIGAFPEGSRRRTRSTGKDHLTPFKKGVFHLARKLASGGSQVTIAPFCLIGSRSAWPSGRILPNAGSKVLLKFCNHVIVGQDDDAELLLERSHAHITEGIESAARNAIGEYDIDQAFEKGIEVDFKREFLCEALLLTIPPIVTMGLMIMNAI